MNRNSGRMSRIIAILKDKHGFVLGTMENMKYKSYDLQLEPGSKLFLYTDGVPEATNEDEELFGTDQIGRAHV